MAPPRSRFLVFTTATLETSGPPAGEAGLEQARRIHPKSGSCFWTAGSGVTCREGLCRGWWGLQAHAVRLEESLCTTRPSRTMEKKRGPRRGWLPELTKRTILMFKQANPDWGCERISAMLARGPALPASPGAVSRVLHEAGYEMEDAPTRPHPDKVRFFERAQPNRALADRSPSHSCSSVRTGGCTWSRLLMSTAGSSSASVCMPASRRRLVLEVLRAGSRPTAAPREVLTDKARNISRGGGRRRSRRNWRSAAFNRLSPARGTRKRWGRSKGSGGRSGGECLEAAVFIDLADARARIGHFIDWYNFHRQHSGVDYLAPADRFFGAAPDVLRTCARAALRPTPWSWPATASPRPPFYMTGQVGGKNSRSACGRRARVPDARRGTAPRSRTGGPTAKRP